MNRLTQKDEQGNWCLRGLKWDDLREGNTITRQMRERLYGALWRLMEYEETGLSPEGINNLNDFEANTRKYLAELDKHRWIPVKERLPKDSKKMVLVQVSGKPEKTITLHNAMELASYDSDHGWIIETWPEWEGAEPVAWMPLPGTYRAGLDVRIKPHVIGELPEEELPAAAKEYLMRRSMAVE